MYLNVFRFNAAKNVENGWPVFFNYEEDEDDLVTDASNIMWIVLRLDRSNLKIHLPASSRNDSPKRAEHKAPLGRLTSFQMRCAFHKQLSEDYVPGTVWDYVFSDSKLEWILFSLQRLFLMF